MCFLITWQRKWHSRADFETTREEKMQETITMESEEYTYLYICIYMYTYVYLCSYMRNLLLRHKKTRLHCGLFIVPYSMMTSPNSFQCLNRSVTWGKVKQEEKIVFKSSGRRKSHLEKKLSAGVEEAKKHRGLNILLLQTFCTSCVRFYCR